MLQADEEEFVRPKEALVRREFYMLWVSRSAQVESLKVLESRDFSSSSSNVLPQVLRQHDHLVSGWLLQSIWPELHLRRPLPIACRRGQWHSVHYSNALRVFNTYFCHPRSVASSTALAGSSTASSWTGKAKKGSLFSKIKNYLIIILCIHRTSYRTAILVEMVILTTLVSTLSLTSGLGKVS